MICVDCNHKIVGETEGYICKETKDVFHSKCMKCDGRQCKCFVHKGRSCAILRSQSSSIRIIRQSSSRRDQSSNGSQRSDDCFIATAVYQSTTHPKVRSAEELTR